MAYSTADARQQLLDTLAEAIDEVGFGLASLGEAYEQLDEGAADELEERLFGPVQAAYGRAKRTHAEFAGRHGLASRTFDPQSAGARSVGARGFIEHAAEAIEAADHALAELQDSLLPVEVGDRELRAGLTEVRATLGGLPERARRLVGRLGR
jgi:hypothetical protein